MGRARAVLQGVAGQSVGWWLLGAGLIVAGGIPRGFAAEPPASAAATVQDNMDVGLEYTLTVDGNVVDSTQGKSAFHYVQGRHQMIPGLERQLTGLHVGDAKDVVVKPEEGYGPVDPSAMIDIPKTQLPPNITPKVGMVLHGTQKDGQSFRAKIQEIKDKTVKLDLNHPLAGKTLNFKIKIATIAPAKAPDVNAGDPLQIRRQSRP